MVGTTGSDVAEGQGRWRLSTSVGDVEVSAFHWRGRGRQGVKGNPGTIWECVDNCVDTYSTVMLLGGWGGSRWSRQATVFMTPNRTPSVDDMLDVGVER